MAELRDEAAKVVQQRAMQIGLGVAVGQSQELEAVGVLELVLRGGMDLCHRR